MRIGFRILSFLPSCYSSYGALDFYPGGTLTHCSCQPSLDAHFSFLIRGIRFLSLTSSQFNRQLDPFGDVKALQDGAIYAFKTLVRC